MATTIHHPIFARIYARFAKVAERRGATEHRRDLLAGAVGRAIEVGAGNGLNFAHYPPSVTSVMALEPERHLRRLAQAAAEHTAVPITVMDGTADRLPFDNAHFDIGVASLVLCSVDDQAVALAELRRVIRPGGELRFYEHVVSEQPGLARIQRIADATIWPRVAGGCHASRDTLTAIDGAGFIIEQQHSFDFQPGPALPAVPHILGVARRPEPSAREQSAAEDPPAPRTQRT